MAVGLLGALPVPRQAVAARFDIDQGLALYFAAPASYTGEHVLELHCHGGAIIVESLITRVLGLGARRARPGEFTQRAYLNGKLDLAQAEAVADLIDAASEAAAQAALRSLSGEFSQRVRALGAALTELRVQVEAAIDFADEPIEALSEQRLGTRLEAADVQLAALLATSRQGRLLTEGLKIVIAGPPNAGKSTLLNRLAGHEAAIVTAIPGTTRDVLRERILIEGVPVQVLDTAGLRPTPGDAIEAEGIRRAEEAMAHADRILFVIDSAADPGALALQAAGARLPPGVPLTLVFNKLDLCDQQRRGENRLQVPPGLKHPAGLASVAISARSGEGLDQLRAHLLDSAGAAQAGEGTLSARQRHIDALNACGAHLASARAQLAAGGGTELVAEELKAAQRQLGELLGTESSDELLGRIFAAFCIGK